MSRGKWNYINKKQGFFSILWLCRVELRIENRKEWICIMIDWLQKEEWEKKERNKWNNEKWKDRWNLTRLRAPQNEERKWEFMWNNKMNRNTEQAFFLNQNNKSGFRQCFHRNANKCSRRSSCTPHQGQQGRDHSSQGGSHGWGHPVSVACNT